MISINLLTSAWNSNDSFGALASFSSSTAKAEGVALSSVVAAAASSAITMPENSIAKQASKSNGEKSLIFSLFFALKIPRVQKGFFLGK